MSNINLHYVFLVSAAFSKSKVILVKLTLYITSQIAYFLNYTFRDVKKFIKNCLFDSVLDSDV